MRRLRGPQPGEVREIDDQIVIGREGVDLQLGDPEASRRHAAVRPVPDGVEIEDLGSSNGTFVNGQRLEGKVTLEESGTLRIGQTELQVEIDLPQRTRMSPTAPPAPDVTVQRPILQPDVTVQRPTVQPEVTAHRPQPDATQIRRQPETVATAAAGGSGASGTPPGKPGRGRMLAFGGGGVALVAIVVLVIVLLSGGSTSKKKNVASTFKPHCAAHFPTVIQDGFPEPPMLFSRNGVLSTTLTASTATATINHTVDQLFEFNGIMPGPTLVLCPGDLAEVNLNSKMPIPMNLHVHGLHVSPVGDGDNVFVTINPFESHGYRYQLPLDQPPGTFWYHPHLHGLVDVETTAGLVGAIIVQGGLDNLLSNIPQRLIFIHGGKLVPPGGKPLPIPGAKPGQIPSPPNPGPAEDLVNGAFNPTLHIQPGQLQRWRIWNGTGERELKIAMAGTTFYVLAKDGNTYQNMIPMKQLVIGAGERLEVLVRGGKTGTTTLDSLPFQPCFRSCFDPFGGVPNGGRNFGFQHLLTVVSGGATVNDPMPAAHLSNPIDLRGRPINVFRTITMARQVVPLKAPVFPLAGKLFDPNRVDITMKLNSIEQWTIQNTCNKIVDEWHNFHIHQNPFQVVSINGKPLNYIDYQDTLNIPPCATVKILINPIDFTGKFVFHCHLTFHEDNGMMGVVQVLANPSNSQVNAHLNFKMHSMPTKTLYASANLKFGGTDAFALYCRHLLEAAGLA